MINAARQAVTAAWITWLERPTLWLAVAASYFLWAVPCVVAGIVLYMSVGPGLMIVPWRAEIISLMGWGALMSAWIVPGLATCGAVVVTTLVVEREREALYREVYRTGWQSLWGMVKINFIKGGVPLVLLLFLSLLSVFAKTVPQAAMFVYSIWLILGMVNVVWLIVRMSEGILAESIWAAEGVTAREAVRLSCERMEGNIWAAALSCIGILLVTLAPIALVAFMQSVFGTEHSTELDLVLGGLFMSFIFLPAYAFLGVGWYREMEQ